MVGAPFLPHIPIGIYRFGASRLAILYNPDKPVGNKDVAVFVKACLVSFAVKPVFGAPLMLIHGEMKLTLLFAALLPVILRFAIEIKPLLIGG